MDRIERESLERALEWARLTGLPKEYDGKEIYIKALQRVVKQDGSSSFVAVRKASADEDKIVKDFGKTSMIVARKEVYPYLYLDASFIPNFKAGDKEGMAKWVSGALFKETLTDTTEELMKLPMKELKKKVISVAIENQLRYQNTMTNDRQDSSNE